MRESIWAGVVEVPLHVPMVGLTKPFFIFGSLTTSPNQAARSTAIEELACGV